MLTCTYTFIYIHMYVNVGISVWQVERIDLGEEVDHAYVSSLLEAAIQEWNSCVRALKSELESPEAILKKLEDSGAVEDGEVEETINKVRAETAMLREIALKPSDANFMLFGCT